MGGKGTSLCQSRHDGSMRLSNSCRNALCGARIKGPLGTGAALSTKCGALGLKGRYISVRIVAAAAETLSVCEVSVLGKPPAPAPKQG